LTRREVYDRQHELLRHVLSLVPTLANTLQPILVRKFPHKRQDKIAQVTYIRNVLRVTEYCAELSDRILATVIDRAIQIDVSVLMQYLFCSNRNSFDQVEIQVELEELEAEGDNSEGPLFEIDPFESIVGQDIDQEEKDEDDGEDALSDLSSEGGEFDNDEPNAAQERNTTHIQDMAIKLDAILKLVFDHFHDTHASSAPVVVYGSASQSSDNDPQWTVPLTTEQGRALRRSQFRTLLFIFERTILRTFKSRYTQFLLFWYSSLDPEFTDNFLGLLLNKALVEFDQPSVTRAAAASYVASFVSRAQFVDGETARRVVGLLCAYLSRQLEVYAEADGPTHTLQYTVFFAVAQAVFLIFCFRWRELQLESGQEEPSNDVWIANGQPSMKKWIPELDVIQRVIISALNPLKVNI
jgi:RNA polymerase I-specific transcription initiation factor RRN3